MVIVCPECSTKFRVNSERIPASGAKVRCARCKHVFLAQKPVEEAPAHAAAPVAEKPVPVATPEPAVEFQSEPAVAEELDQTPEPEPEQDFQAKPTPEPEEAFVPTPVEEEEPFSGDFDAEEETESSFSYDQFRELDPAPLEEEENFSFTSATAEVEEAANELKEAEEEEDFSFSGPTDEPVEEMKESVEAAAEESAPAAKKKKYSDEELTALFADDKLASTAEAPEAEQAVPVAKKSSPFGSLIRILLLLILGLAIIGGALYFLNGPEQIEQAIQQLLGQQVQPAESGRISLGDLEGKFINNQEAGELFVIRGSVTNNYREPRASIQVKGIIFDQNGKQLLQKTIFCGNPISDQELQTLPFSKLEEMMRNQFGQAMNNMKVNHKETISFVIAFRDLPKNLSEFSVDIASSEPAAQ